MLIIVGIMILNLIRHIAKSFREDKKHVENSKFNPQPNNTDKRSG